MWFFCTPLHCPDTVPVAEPENRSDTPSSFRLIGAYPNPFNPHTTIFYDLGQEIGHSLRIFDMSGRLVRELRSEGAMRQGRQEVVWDGRDDRGRQVSSGVYFYRLEAGDFSQTKRMVLIK